MAMETLVKQLIDGQKANAEAMSSIASGMQALTKHLARTPAKGHPNASDAFGLPNARIGEDPMGSRGISFAKMVGLISGGLDPDEVKHERDIAERLHGCLGKSNDGYRYGGSGQTGQNRFLMPLGTGLLPDSMVPRQFKTEMKQMVVAGAEGADPEEVLWLRKREWKRLGYGEKALSWLNELSAGALVAPPEQGELIELLRSKEALVNAGARVVPLPPQGRLRYPRQTTASVAYWVGESAPIPESSVGVGDVVLQAKKLAVLIKTSNELIRFANPAAEALMRDDMTKSMALGLDLAGLEGAGSDNSPRGLLNLPGIQRLTSSVTAADGDALVGQDIYRFIAAVEEINAEMEGFVMRPKTLLRYYQMRTSAVAQGDREGPFLFGLIREAGDGLPKPSLAGYPVTKSTQVSQVRNNGTGGTDLTYIAAGMWSDLLIGMFGAVEFAATMQGDTTFINDQTWVRGILSADIAARHEAAFVVMDNLDVVRK